MEKRSEKGNVVIEASIVMTIAVVMVAVLINMGTMLYHKNLMNKVATETAVNIANVFSSTYRDPMYGYIHDSEFYKVELYRHFFDIFTGSYDEIMEKRAEWYAIYSLQKGRVSKLKNPKIEVDVISKPGTIIQQQVVVTIQASFDVPLAAVWGGENETTYVAVGKADCIDLLDYFNIVGTAKEALLDKLDTFVKDISKVLEIFNLESMKG